VISTDSNQNHRQSNPVGDAWFIDNGDITGKINIVFIYLLPQNLLNKIFVKRHLQIRRLEHLLIIQII
jgi:hypothetical protein